MNTQTVVTTHARIVVVVEVEEKEGAAEHAQTRCTTSPPPKQPLPGVRKSVENHPTLVL